MKPGRELDALVAEKVMGWSGVQDDIWEDDEGYADVLYQGRPGHGRHPDLLQEVPQYSTDIAAAWGVVEEARALVSLEVEFALWGSEDGTWDAAFGAEDIVTAATAPHAICLAALEAVGAKGAA